MPLTTMHHVPPVNRLRLQWLQPAQRYAYTFGNSLMRLHVAEGSLYERKEQAIADAMLTGLAVDDEGEVTSIAVKK